MIAASLKPTSLKVFSSGKRFNATSDPSLPSLRTFPLKTSPNAPCPRLAPNSTSSRVICCHSALSSGAGPWSTSMSRSRFVGGSFWPPQQNISTLSRERCGSSMWAVGIGCCYYAQWGWSTLLGHLWRALRTRGVAVFRQQRDGRGWQTRRWGRKHRSQE